jgi:hypothetical protein
MDISQESMSFAQSVMQRWDIKRAWNMLLKINIFNLLLLKA